MKNEYFYQKAEVYVAALYEKLGWSLVHQGYRGVGFEIDLILQFGYRISFVEVKYRTFSGNSLSFIEGLVTDRKKKSLYRGAKDFLSKSERFYQDYSFDLVVVTKKFGSFHAEIYSDIFN